jgi:hypothetical protein
MLPRKNCAAKSLKFVVWPSFIADRPALSGEEK